MACYPIVDFLHCLGVFLIYTCLAGSDNLAKLTGSGGIAESHQASSVCKMEAVNALSPNQLISSTEKLIDQWWKVDLDVMHDILDIQIYLSEGNLLRDFRQCLALR